MTVDPHLADPNTAFWQDIGFLQKFCGFSKINEFELNFFKPISDLVEDVKNIGQIVEHNCKLQYSVTQQANLFR